VYVPLVARPELPAGETWERRTAAERRLAGRMLDAETTGTELASARLASALSTHISAAPVQMEEAMKDHSRVVVIGDPGSGKSTLLKHLALRLAGEDDTPLPILVPLNAYADALSKGDRNVQQYLPEYFAGLSKGIEGLGPLFDEAIAKGTAVILLDGLDEVQRDRPHLVNKVEAFAQEAVARGNKLVVTSRVVGYRESPLGAKEWALCTLLDFDRTAIEAFAAKWCAAFEKSTSGDTPEARAQAEVERKSLLEAIDANPGVANLASNPLLLTILALIKRQGVSLPNRRVELYELYLKTLISAWSKARALDRRPVGPPMDYVQTINVLGPLALWLREENPTAGLVSERQILDWLTKYYMSDEWGLRRGPAIERAAEFLKSVRTYSNLVLERGQGQFGFIHLTFEEALAAYGLVGKGQLDWKDSMPIIERHLTEPGWRETILLAVGVWGHLNRQNLVAGEVVRAMLKMDCTGDDACTNVLIAGACLEDVGEAGLGRAAASEVIEALLAASRNRSLKPTVQRDAGFILGRVAIQVVSLRTLSAKQSPSTAEIASSSYGLLAMTLRDLDTFIPIPAGPFLYGEDKKKVVIKRPFEIARYPVTNLQYRRFVEAKGYDRREFWGDEGWSWRIGTYDSKATEKRGEDWLAKRPPEKRSEPYSWHDMKRNNPLAPVVGVCWFEAEAYCNWLAHELGKPIRLPTEEEWERAARHTDGREYPWGETFDRNRLNSAEFWGGKNDLDWRQWVDDKGYEAASMTIVGQFPDGNSIAGVSDLSGNVWEWTNSWYNEEQLRRTVRGGSWYDARYSVRCASHPGFVPDGFGSNHGFRVASPSS
jgi:formylglycine-generating enzyme required for sulfatase activity/energy-coupling factor transporter ATP-binding protein EcfA2